MIANIQNGIFVLAGRGATTPTSKAIQIFGLSPCALDIIGFGPSYLNFRW
jgi:hypothetical protein